MHGRNHWDREEGAGRSRGWGGVLALVIAGGAGVVAFVSGCVHRTGEPPPGSAAVCGCIEVVVHEDLDYLLPRQVRRSHIRLTIEPEGDGTRGLGWIRVYTDRDGCFYRDGLAPGRYRVVKIQSFGERQGSPGLTTPDLEFDLWESALRVRADGVTAVPTATGRLDAATFDLTENEVHYLGHFVLEYQQDAFEQPSGGETVGNASGSVQPADRTSDESLSDTSSQPTARVGACLTRMARVKGIAGEVYLSSIPVGTRLCVEERAGEADRCVRCQTP